MQKTTIGLIDCDSFFVSCEQLAHPELRGKAVCVMTGGGERGIIVSRSKEAKLAGIKMGETYFQACPRRHDVVYLPARHDFYKQVSAKVMNIFKNFTPDVEAVSIDEAYMDMGGVLRLHGQDSRQLAESIRRAVREQAGIPVSVGIAPSKTLAKLASDKAKKINGVFVITDNQILDIVGQTAIDEVCGIGRQHNRFLLRHGIFTVQDFLKLDNTLIRCAMGIGGLNLKYELSGCCTSKVDPAPHPPKSIQDTSVLDCFIRDISVLESALRCHVRNACRKLRRWNGYCSSVGVMLRTKDFQVSSEHVRIAPDNSEYAVTAAAVPLLRHLYSPGQTYRSCGIMLESISYRQQFQPSLFENAPDFQDSRLCRTIDALEQKFGKNIVKIGCF